MKHQTGRSEVDHKISQSFGVKWVPEDPKKTEDEHLIPTTRKVNEVLDPIAEKSNFVDLKIFGTFDGKTVIP